MIPTITIKDAARLVGLRTDKPGRNPKQLAQAIKYSLERKPEDWTAAGVDPATVQRGVKDPYTETIASVMGWPTPEEVRASMNYAKADAAASDAMATLTEAAKDFGGAAKKVAGTFPKHTHDQGEETIYIPSHPAIIHPAVDPDPKFKAKKTKAKKEQTRLATHAEPKKVKPLADIVAGRTVIMVGLSVVLLADFVACCLNWWTHLDDKPEAIRTGSAIAFGVVGIIVGLSGFVNFIRNKDDEGANLFAFVFGAYQLTIHGVLLFPGWSFIGCGAEIIGLVFVPSAILTVIRQEIR